MTKPTKEQIEKLAFELFNADYGLQMIQLDWDWRPDRIKNYYRFMAATAAREWEKIKNSPK